VGPDDLIATARSCHEATAPLADRDWSTRAGDLEWSCRETLAHLCGLAYAPVLATRAKDFRPLALAVVPEAPVDDLLWTMRTMAAVLAEVARAAPPSARAFHPAGPADATGFVAMGSAELLAHTHDITAGLGEPFEPDHDTAVAVLDRLFPWWPRDTRPVPALLWANGRIALPDHDRLGEEWLWHSAPLEEWDGSMPRWDPVAKRPAPAS